MRKRKNFFKKGIHYNRGNLGGSVGLKKGGGDSVTRKGKRNPLDDDGDPLDHNFLRNVPKKPTEVCPKWLVGVPRYQSLQPRAGWPEWTLLQLLRKLWPQGSSAFYHTPATQTPMGTLCKQDRAVSQKVSERAIHKHTADKILVCLNTSAGESYNLETTED